MMSNEEINIAIAQACGWTDTEIVNEGGKLMYGQTEVPNYCGDLNDTWAAEAHLTPDQQVEFVYQLSEIVAPITGESWMLIHASAFARAKAFLRTVGKWKEA
jgi:predicted enzyme related to lactoylglutathione lyase